ncbi:DMT family transporter [Peptostreptococcus equinus]|uniref:DMT family transporter n=1 Tax=Peptostreptococcus equinus TaxID=3003601 RepID=A0ABY7JNV8_9FIRM|nr:DMT family transporter [Peptostreptococcus sp. CBA3647]WAW14556.1 DMT family transporter [Peptostreptococcus sp. CBA3647]
MKKNYRNNIKFGVTSGLSSGILWGLDTVITGIILTMYSFVSDVQVIAIAPIVAAFLHDLSSAFWMTLVSVFKKDFFNTIKLIKTRSGRFVALAAIFGGPVGMMAYMFAISNIGPGYTAAISAVYPAAGAFFGYIFLKDKLSIKGWIGLSMSILSIIILGYSPGDADVKNFAFGFIAALITILGWSLESVICAYGMKDDIMPMEALTIRQVTSALIYLVIVVVFIKGGSLSYHVLTTKTMLYILITALIGTCSYIFYYSAIDSIGPVKATGLNITYSIWAIIFSLVIFGGDLSFKLVFCSILIIIGSVLVSKDQAQ